MGARLLSIVLCFAFFATSLAAPARADQLSAEKKAAAETLFEEGKRLKKELKFLEAAGKFEQVQKLDPGIGTLLFLAESYEQAGRLASAWGNYRDAMERARKEGDSRQKVASERAARLENKLARLSIGLAENTPSAGLVVSRNGIDLDASTAEVAIPVDAGPVAIVVRAPGYQPYHEEFAILDGEQKRVSVPPLVRLPEAPKAPPTQPVAFVKPKTSPPAEPTSGGTATKLRYGALGLTLGTLAGGGVAIGYALHALKLDDDAGQYCSGLSCTDLQGETLSRQALEAGSIATVGVIAAGATGAGALGLLIASFAVGPKRDVAWSVTPWLDGKKTGLTVGGAF